MFYSGNYRLFRPATNMISFTAKIYKIGINPYVLLPSAVLKALFREAGKDKGPIRIKGTLNRENFQQTLVKYSGKWRLYLNTSMRTAAGVDVGDVVKCTIRYDPDIPVLEMHPKLLSSLAGNSAAASIFGKLAPSYQKEIIRYINLLKTEEAVDRNVEKAINHLLGNDRFVGRDGIQLQ